MKKLRSRRPSPAMALAFVALMVALSGAAIALPGKGSVQGNDIKKNAITGKAVKNDSLTGSDVNESTLGQVPSAATSDSATTSDETARLLHWSTGEFPEGTDKTLLTIGGLTLTASCVADTTKTQLKYVVSGPADGFGEGLTHDLAPGSLPGIINSDADSASVDLLDAEDGGFMLGDASGVRVVGVLGGLVDGAGGASGICEAWGFATIDN